MSSVDTQLSVTKLVVEAGYDNYTLVNILQAKFFSSQRQPFKMRDLRRCDFKIPQKCEFLLPFRRCWSLK